MLYLSHVPHCWKSHVAAQMIFTNGTNVILLKGTSCDQATLGPSAAVLWWAENGPKLYADISVFDLVLNVHVNIFSAMSGHTST